MYLQGSLQKVFDALYQLGVIDPVLEMDWTEAMKELVLYKETYLSLVSKVNTSAGGVDELIDDLKCHDEKLLCFLAIEVAKEFANFHSRETLH